MGLVRSGSVSVMGLVRIRGVGAQKSDIFVPKGCTFREGFGDGFGTKREGFGNGFGTYQGRGCLEKRIFPLLWGVRFGKVSVMG